MCLVCAFTEKKMKKGKTILEKKSILQAGVAALRDAAQTFEMFPERKTYPRKYRIWEDDAADLREDFLLIGNDLREAIGQYGRSIGKDDR
jgi:hypothetical protein